MNKMSLYRRLHTPNSPLVPLSPMMPMPSPSMYLTPYTTSIRSRRSFTPTQLNMLSPPSVSPIRAALSVKNTNFDQNEGNTTPQQKLNCSLVFSSTKKSMKKIRSAARISRKIEARNNRSKVPLTPICRSLHFEGSPSFEGHDSPKASGSQLKVIPYFEQSTTPKPFLTSSDLIAVTQEITSPFVYNEHGITHSLLEETFTVTSILKEINMQKYAVLFAKEEIDLFVFLLLTSDDMVVLGIDPDDRDILLNAVCCYREFFGNPEKMYF
ncbi:uncharacterized protein LOC116337648 [Contarinia nasturtii]|uniref:uncharacterized protein LOC116337648 n=1 Tax=Contarinia nasturtii TaxID=265458 RepID=UPI0012D4BF8F|nr:uncharacterized protein LOC116337648 [Contarinia nasturtii]